MRAEVFARLTCYRMGFLSSSFGDAKGDDFLLQIKNVTITHKKDLRTIIKDLSFVLNPGDRAVVIGEEGNGKSTLLKVIYDKSLVADYAEYEGEIIKNGNRIGYLAQELRPEEKEKSVWEFFSECPLFYDLQPQELSDIARRLKLPGDFFYLNQEVGTLSGGEKVKLQMAKLLMESPDVLLLDEPSNDIDIETLEWLEDFINQSSAAVLFVSHDELLIERTANMVIHMEQLRRKTMPRQIVAKMPYAQYISERLSSMEKQEQLARKEKSEYEKKMEKYRQIEQRVDYLQEIHTRQDPAGARLLKKKMHAVKSMGRRFEREKENMTQMPESEEAIFVRFGEDVSIPAGKRILDFQTDALRIGDRRLTGPVELHVRGPEKLVIVGRNGVGKTTLLKRIADELLPRTDIRAAYMPQNYEELLDFEQNPVEFLSKSYDKEKQTRIRTYLGSMKYTTDEMAHSIKELSGGQKAKILLLKMSLEGNDVLILDEPTRNFSPLSNPVIRNVLNCYQGCIISISHDRKYIEEVCGRIYRLTEQGLIEEEKQDVRI